MSENEERDKGFKVTDRRSFTAEGERRFEAEEPQSTPPPTPEPTPEPTRAETKSERGFQAAWERGRPQARFLDLLSLLVTQASLHLGEPHPVSGEQHEDLSAAQMMISLIEVLQTKTKGNLSREEEQALENVLYQLRMAFIEKAKINKG